MKSLFLITCVFALCTACSHPSNASDRHYHLTGVVKSVDAKEHTANIDAEAIPNYMEAMAMDYPVKSASDLNQLHPGERIEATINIHSDDSYDLTGIHPAAAKK